MAYALYINDINEKARLHDEDCNRVHQHGKKGGDIDLLVVSKEVTKKDLRLLRIDFFDHFEEQKLDIVLDDGEFKNPFTKHIIKGAILL